jgi:hypothetical protein
VIEPSTLIGIPASGVGLPVVQLLEDAGMKPIKVSITGSADQNEKINRTHWRVGKAVPVSHLDAEFHSGTLKISPHLLEAPSLKEELADFDRHIGASGRASYAARATAHDDLVMALALAIWRCKQPKPTIYVGAIRGCY